MTALAALLLAGLLVAVAHAQLVHYNSHFHAVNKTTIEHIIAQFDPSDAPSIIDNILVHPYMLLYFHTPWCEHCQGMQHVLQDISLEFVAKGYPVTILAIDASKSYNKDLIKMYGIKGFPAIQLYQHDVHIADYHGSRQVQPLLDFINRQTSHQVIEKIGDMSQLYEKISRFDSQWANGTISVTSPLQRYHYSSDIFGVCLFAVTSSSDVSEYEQYQMVLEEYGTIAKELTYLKFLYTDSAEIRDYFQLSAEENSVVLLRQWLNTVEKSSLRQPAMIPPLNATVLAMSVDSLVKDAIFHVLPNGFTLDRNTQPLVRLHPIKSHVLIFGSLLTPEDDDFEEMSVILELDRQFNDLLLLWINMEYEYHVPQFFGLNKEKCPYLCIIVANMSDPYNMRQYRFSDFTIGDGRASIRDVNHVTSFLRSYLEGSLPQYVVSETLEELEEANTHFGYGQVTLMETIGAVNFREKVLDDPSHHSFVYFYTNWCLWCKAVEAALDSPLLKRYNEDGRSAVKIYRINGIKNEVYEPNLHLTAFPSFYFFPRGDKYQPIKYEGDRTAEAIEEFLQQQLAEWSPKTEL